MLERSEVARPCFFAAGVRVALGEHDAAFDLLEQACDERDKWIGWLRVDPAIAELRSLPRFEAVLARAGFPTTASRA